MGTATGWNHPAQISWSLVTHWPTLWVCPTPLIIVNLCANIFRENRYDYVLEDLPSKLDDKTYDRNEKFIRLLSYLISLGNYRICGWTLNFNKNIYEITHDDVFHHQQIDCCFKSLFRPTTKKASRHRLSGLLWGESTADWIAVLPKHHSQLHLTQFWIQMDIYEPICS